MEELCAALSRQAFKPGGHNTMQITVTLGLLVCITAYNVHVG